MRMLHLKILVVPKSTLQFQVIFSCAKQQKMISTLILCFRMFMILYKKIFWNILYLGVAAGAFDNDIHAISQ